MHVLFFTFHMKQAIVSGNKLIKLFGLKMRIDGAEELQLQLSDYFEKKSFSESKKSETKALCDLIGHLDAITRVLLFYDFSGHGKV